MLLKIDGDGPITARLYRALRGAILDGRLTAGERLPSSRALVDQLGVSRNVVLRVYQQLVLEGHAEARAGSGTYVSHDFARLEIRPRRSPADLRRHAQPGAFAPALSALARRAEQLRPLPAPGTRHRPGPLYDFRYGTPDLAGFPQDTWTRLVTRRARTLTTGTLGYGRARGFAPLREVVARYLARARGVEVPPEQVVIVNGTQQALHLVAALLVDPGDRVVVEEPGYQAARQVFALAGAALYGVEVDHQGLDTARLPRGSARLAYVTPSHQFPLGGVMPHHRRLALLEWAAQAGAVVVEDDYDSEFRYDAPPTEAVRGLDRDGRVLYIGSFSKVLAPALRLAYLVVPPALVDHVAGLKFLVDQHTPTFEQTVVADFIAGGHLERHLRRMRTRNAARRRTLLAAVTASFGGDAEVVGANAGVHVVLWLRTLPASSLAALVARGLEAGLGLYPVSPYYITAPERAGLLLGYAGLTEQEIEAGIASLARVVRGVALRPS
jgi:GntR family transcriptional regulator / MocR family aminotransferase